MSGGGGQSGTVAFPNHMEETHQDWLGHTLSLDNNIDTNVVDVMNAALGVGGNPWSSVTLTDPSTDFTEVENRYDTYETAVDALDEETDWESIVGTAVDKVDAAGVLNDVDFSNIVTAARSASDTNLEQAVTSAINLMDSDIITSVTEEFERRASKQRNKSINRFSATMADINAVQSSAFMFGMAMIESEHLQRVDEFQSRLNLQLLRQGVETFSRDYANYVKDRLRSEIINKSSREQLLREGANIMVRLLIGNMEFKENSTHLLSEIKRVQIVGKQEYELAEADLNYKDARWDFEVFQNGMYTLGGISGPGGVLPDKPSKAASAIGGVLSGAAKGSQASGGNPVVAGVGGVLGGVAGLLQ